MIYELDKQGIGSMQFLGKARSSFTSRRTEKIQFFPLMQ